MSSAFNAPPNDFFAAALALPEAQRLALATKLWSSLRPPNVMSEDDPDVAQRLLKRVNDADAETIDGDEAMAILWERQRARSKP
jgi:hypothetical protein